MADLYYRHDVFRPFPGLGGYAFKSDSYCPGCAEELEFGEGPWSWQDFRDSEKVPQPFTASSVEPGAACSRCHAALTTAPAGDELADDPRASDGS